MSYEIKDKFTSEILKNLKDAELGYNYYNIRVRHADLAKEIEDAGGMPNVMLKSEYDTNNDGKVDNAEHADNATQADNATHADNADNATHANNSDKLENHPANDFGANGLVSSGSDLNNQVRSGFYRLENNLQNAPSSEIEWGQMIVSRGNAGDTVLQIVGDYSSNKLFWRSGNPPEAGGGGNWGAWRVLYPQGEKYYVTPEDYGASGDGISDDSAAFQNMFDNIKDKYAIIILGAKQYKLTQKLNIYVNKGLKILGSGLQVTKIFYPSLGGGNWGFNVIYGNDELACLTLQGFSFLTNMTNMDKGAIFAEWPLENRPYVSSSDIYQQSPYWKLIVNQVQIAGEASGDNGWGYGLYMKGVNNTSISNYLFWGKKHSESGDLIPDSHHAICYDTHQDNAAATGHYLRNSFVFFADNAVYCSQHIEGLHIDKSEFVAINYGVNLNLSNRWPFFAMYNCHVNARLVGFNVVKGSSIHVVGNNFASREGCTQQFIGTQLMDALYCQVNGNHFVKNSGGDWGGIVVGNGSNHYHIGTNIFQAGAISGTTNVGIWLQSTAGSNAVIEPETKHIWDGSFDYKILDQR